MSQTSTIAAFLFVGFVVFITIRGELPQYKAAIFGGQTASTTNTPASQSTSASTSSLNKLTPLTPLAPL